MQPASHNSVTDNASRKLEGLPVEKMLETIGRAILPTPQKGLFFWEP